jgi:hypothetical protein
LASLKAEIRRKLADVCGRACVVAAATTLCVHIRAGDAGSKQAISRKRPVREAQRWRSSRTAELSRSAPLRISSFCGSNRSCNAISRRLPMRCTLLDDRPVSLRHAALVCGSRLLASSASVTGRWWPLAVFPRRGVECNFISPSFASFSVRGGWGTTPLDELCIFPLGPAGNRWPPLRRE